MKEKTENKERKICKLCRDYGRVEGCAICPKPKLSKDIIQTGLELKEKLLDLNFAIEDFLQALSSKK